MVCGDFLYLVQTVQMPHPTSLFQNFTQLKVIDDRIDYQDYVPIDLSAQNPDLQQFDLTDAAVFEQYIENHLAKHQAKVAYGGYLERRNLYKRSTVFLDHNVPERHIHIGLDLWIKAGTKVLAALDGHIHSFQDNTALGDYGPTIILSHEYENQKFYTLYGHLSLESLENKKTGDAVTQGQIIATLGAPPINGDYAPHLHFQLILDLQGKTGDYPGVSSENDLPFYKENCPDPNLLLKIR